MKLVVQRVSGAKLTVDKKIISEIGKGYFVLVGIKTGDTKEQADLLAEKLSKLRVMSDAEGRMNLSVKDVQGEMLVVSQFTLYADTKGGNRPGFTTAARPEEAQPLYDYFAEKLRTIGVTVKTGVFGADMQIDASCDGPVTILLEQQNNTTNITNNPILPINKQMQNGQKIQDIHERIYQFVTRVINLTKAIDRTPQNLILINQIIKSVTSMGANDQEADGTDTKNDFIAKYAIVRKEGKETNYWLRLIAETNPSLKERMDDLQVEGKEIVKIVSTIIINTKKKK